MTVVDDPILIDDREIPAVKSPYEGRLITTVEHIKISAYWFATNFMWGPLLLLILPGEIKHLVPYYSVTALGLITGLTALAALLIPLIVGALSDRCASPLGRRRPYIAWGSAINVIGLGLMAVTYSNATPLGKASEGVRESWLQTVFFILSNPTFDLFLLSYLVVQVGNNIASAAYSGVIPDLVPHEQRGKASGFMALMTQIGTVAGLITVGMLLGPASDVGKYAFLAFVFSGVGLVTIYGIQETPLPVRPPKLKWGPYVRGLWISPRKYPDFAWVWLTRALVMLGFYSVLPYLNYFLGDVVKVENPDGFMVKLSAAILVLAAISGIIGGMISDKIGRKRVVYLANGMIAVVSIGFIFCKTQPTVLIAAALFGLGYGAYISVDWALGSDVLPSKKDAAKEMGVWHISMTLPQALAAPIAGALIEQFGKTVEQTPKGPLVHYTQNGYAAMFVMCCVCFGLGAVLIKNVKSVQ